MTEANPAIAPEYTELLTYYDSLQGLSPGYRDVVSQEANLTSRVDCVSSTVVPGLLQTRGYAMGTMKESSPAIAPPDSVAEQRVRLRQMRREAFFATHFGDADRPALRAVLTESVLHTAARYPEQLPQLSRYVEKGRIALGIVPLGARLNPTLITGVWNLFENNTVSTVLVTHREYTHEEVVTTPQQVQAARADFDRLWEQYGNALPEAVVATLGHIASLYTE